MDLNRVIAASGKQSHARISLSDFQHENLSPLRSEDLLASADHPEEDPYYDYFSACLPALIEKDADGVVGFSLTYLSQAIPTFAMIGFLRREFPALRLILGGGLVTSWIKCRSMYRTEGPPSILSTTCASQILSNNVVGSNFYECL